MAARKAETWAEWKVDRTDALTAEQMVEKTAAWKADL
jgi:hypothetical protein